MDGVELQIADESGRLRERFFAVVAPDGTRSRHGLCEVFHANGTLAARGEYLEGKKHGLWEEWHEDGRKFAEKSYRRGIAHGRWMNYYLDGSTKCERHFVEGVEHGTRVTRYLRGVWWIEEYAGGLKHGLCLELDDGGRVLARRRYHQGHEL